MNSIQRRSVVFSSILLVIATKRFFYGRMSWFFHSGLWHTSVDVYYSGYLMVCDICDMHGYCIAIVISCMLTKTTVCSKLPCLLSVIHLLLHTINFTTVRPLAICSRHSANNDRGKFSEANSGFFKSSPGSDAATQRGILPLTNEIDRQLYIQAQYMLRWHA